MGSISLSSAAEARSYLNTMTMRQKYLTLGAFCAAYCRVVSVHHAIEDQQLFATSRMRMSHWDRSSNVCRMSAKASPRCWARSTGHSWRWSKTNSALDETQSAVDHLSDALLAHLKYEEEQLLEPIGRLAIRV